MASQERSGAGAVWSESMGNSMVKRVNALLTLALRVCCRKRLATRRAPGGIRDVRD